VIWYDQKIRFEHHGYTPVGFFLRGGMRMKISALEFSRALGKLEENIRIQNDQEKREAVQKRLNELFMMVREKTNLPT